MGEESTLGMICQVLDEDELAYQVQEDAEAIEMHIVGKSCFLTPLILVRSDPLDLLIFVPLPLVVPEERRGEMVEAINRANWGLKLGSFEMDRAGGVVHFRSGIPILDGHLTVEQIRCLLFLSIGTADRYSRAFGRLIFDKELSASEAIAEVEMAE